MIFYAEDDKNIRDLVVYTLKSAGLEARAFPDGTSFWEAAQAEPPELALLDIMLPGIDGLTLLSKLRDNPATSDVPVLMLTAKGGEYDKVVGLNSGADDYLAKPFGMMELTARVRALLRRSSNKAEKDELEAENVKLSKMRRTVAVCGKPVTLTFKEFELLCFLMENKGLAFSREKLLSAVWGYDYDGGSRTVDVHIQTLRQKLGAECSLIHTVRGVGYRAGQ